METLSRADRDLCGALVVGLRGPALGADESAWLAAYRPAGVILFGRNVTGPVQLRRLCADIRGILGADAEVVADHEGGPVAVLAAAVGRPPAAATLGRLNDPALTERVHREIGERLAAMGVGRALAPCCDVLREPRNAVIGARSFGAAPDLVAAHVGAAVRGLIAGGVRACPKHWPGHGGTRIDTHLGSVSRAVEPDLGSYAAAAAAGADALMVGHLPLVDGGEPASLASGARDDLRRRFPGLLPWSDDLTMAALRETLVVRTGEDPGGEGMVEPGIYPRAWLREAGRTCGRLLIRGIPWGAFPPATTTADGAGRPEERAPEPEVVAEIPASWSEARKRAAGNVLPPDTPAVWWDLTGDHRWGGLSPDSLRRAGLRGSVHLVEAGSPVRRFEDGAVLLVTSHRPLTEPELGLLREMPKPKRCLVFGHPSLRDDLSGACPGIECLGAGFDASVEEIGAWYGR